MRRSRIRISRGGCRRMTVFHYAIRDISLIESRETQIRVHGDSVTRCTRIGVHLDSVSRGTRIRISRPKPSVHLATESCT